MSRVVVVSTGGTLAMRPDPSTGKLVPAVSGEEVVDMLAWPEAPPLELDDFAFPGEIHSAREVRKVHTSALRAFDSPGYGPIGHVDHGTVAFQRLPERRAPLPVPGRLAPVDLIRLYAGSDARFIRASAESGARAIVLEGTGRGNANDQVVEGVREAVLAGVQVVVCSRCVAGRVEPVYGRGGVRDLADAGALFAGDLAGPKARVLLQLALASGLYAASALEAEAG